mgnify:CR=1 FL=1
MTSDFEVNNIDTVLETCVGNVTVMPDVKEPMQSKGPDYSNSYDFEKLSATDVADIVL